MNARIRYIELKADGVTGPSRIGRVNFSNSGKTVRYLGKTFQSCRGFKCNYFDVETEEGYWISRCKRNGQDRLYPGTIEIDDEVREEYWTSIRRQPENKKQKSIRGASKYGGKKR